MKTMNLQEESSGESGAEASQRPTERGYASYNDGSKLSFDPMKDLNLPANYDEVMARFKRLQGDRAMEALN
jgi:hypothetical protein